MPRQYVRVHRDDIPQHDFFIRVEVAKRHGVKDGEVLGPGRFAALALQSNDLDLRHEQEILRSIHHYEPEVPESERTDLWIGAALIAASLAFVVLVIMGVFA